MVSCLATAGVAFLVLPDDEPPAPPAAEMQTSAVDVARQFWDHAIAGECRAASRLMWWPADIEARRDNYVQICAEARGRTERVDIGDPRPAGSVDVPFGASDYLLLPVTLDLRDDETVETELAMVEVDDQWYVIR